MFALLLAGSLALSAPVPKPVKAKVLPDAERLLGAWEVYDDETSVGTGTKTVWTFTDGKMHSNNGNSEWVVKLDPDQSPKHITLTQVRGNTDLPGIYEFDGEKLKIAYSVGRDWPTGFTAVRGVNLNILVKAKEQPSK